LGEPEAAKARAAYAVIEGRGFGVHIRKAIAAGHGQQLKSVTLLDHAQQTVHRVQRGCPGQGGQ